MSNAEYSDFDKSYISLPSTDPRERVLSREDKTIYEPDGRTLLFLTNKMFYPDTNGCISSHSSNSQVIFKHLAERGVVELPEIEATGCLGQPASNLGYVAVYVDSRLGKRAASDLAFHSAGRWLYDHEPRLQCDVYRRELIPPNELVALVDRGIVELGIDETLEQMRLEDEQRLQSQATVYDLDDIMGQFNRGEL